MVARAYEPEPLPVHLVYPKGSMTAAKVRAFAELGAPRLREALHDRPSGSRARRKR